MSDFAQSFGRLAMKTVLVSASFLLLAGQAMATPDATGLTNERWGDWRALSEGFVGRRREPPGLERAVEQRRLPEVQVQARLQERPGTNGRERAAQALERMGEVQAANIPPWAQALLVQQQSDRVSTGVTPRRNSNSAWLMTGAPGLYSVPLDDIAAQAGMNIRTLRLRARTGRLSLLNEGEPVSWRYDAASDSLQFAAEAYETFYAQGNAYQLIFTDGRDDQQMSEIRPLPTGIDRGWSNSGWNSSGWNSSGWNSSGWNNRGFGNASGLGNNASGRGSSTPPAGQPTPFRDTVRFEEEGDMLFAPWVAADQPDADYWFWDFLFGGSQDTIDLTLDLPDPAAAGVGELRVELRGRTKLNPGNEHQVYAELNGQRLGSVAWDGFDVAVLVAQFDQGLLRPDGNNMLRLGSVYPAGTTPGQFLNAVEVDYQRNPVAHNGELWLRGVSGGGTQAVNGFSSPDILVVESPLRGAKLRNDGRVYREGAGWAVDFATDPGTDFLVVESSALRAPVIEGPASADLRNRRNGAAYLIIAPREFAAAAEALADYRSASFGAVKIAWLDDIYKEFGAGRVDPFAIGQFMRTAVGDWRQAPAMVLLLGRGSLDHKDRMGLGDSFVPVLMTSNPWTLAPSDARLLGFESGITPFAFGRLPIMNDGEGLAYLEKLRRHEGGVGSSQQNRAVVSADNPDDAGNFHADADALLAQMISLGIDEFVPLYHRQGETTVRSGLTSSSNWESRLVSYSGHGWALQLGDHRENFLKVDDADALSNGTYPVFSAFTCSAAQDAFPGVRAVSSHLVLNSQGGAIAAIAPTGLSLNADAHVLGREFLDSLYGGGSSPVGTAFANAKSQAAGQVSEFTIPLYTVVGDPAVHSR
jgi:hypothetical protein